MLLMQRHFVSALVMLGLFTLPLSSKADEPSDCSQFSPSNPQQIKALIEKYGGELFRNPISVSPTSEANKHDIVVQYATNRIVGCNAHLRSYGGKVVGDTIRAKPGDTLYLRLVNALPPVADGHDKHPQDPPPGAHAHHFNFNITNLHTHGLHTAPQGPIPAGEVKAEFESDNVLIELSPGDEQEYRIHIDEDHPAGTFWYHAHLHGSTALQLASGMAGALIIEGGKAENGDLDVVPEINAAKSSEKIFVLQQFGYDKNGTIETISLNPRPTMINGQLVPIIRMRPGEVQRWRFIHAGTEELVALALDGHPLHEVAADGISLGRSVVWPDTKTAEAGPVQSMLVLAPGNRVDVLVKAELEPGQTSRTVFLRDLPLPDNLSLRAAETINLLAEREGQPDTFAHAPIDISDKPEQLLAQVIIEGDPVDMHLPDDLTSIKPTALAPITDSELQQSEVQSVKLQIAKNRMCEGDGSCRECVTGDPVTECKKLRYLIDGNQFSDTQPRRLKLGTAAEWTLTGLGIETTPGEVRFEPHPFHIHVNPFYYERDEPGGIKNWVWKDTLIALAPEKVRTRYTKFTGKFVLHCHILKHEDKGMMQLVEIVP